MQNKDNPHDETPALLDQLDEQLRRAEKMQDRGTGRRAGSRLDFLLFCGAEKLFRSIGLFPQAGATGELLGHLLGRLAHRRGTWGNVLTLDIAA